MFFEFFKINLNTGVLTGPETSLLFTTGGLLLIKMLVKSCRACQFALPIPCCQTSPCLKSTSLFGTSSTDFPGSFSFSSKVG